MNLLLPGTQEAFSDLQSLTHLLTLRGMGRRRDGPVEPKEDFELICAVRSLPSLPWGNWEVLVQVTWGIFDTYPLSGAGTRAASSCLPSSHFRFC